MQDILGQSYCELDEDTTAKVYASLTENMHDTAVRLADGRCGHGCDGCPAASWRDNNGACLIRRIAKIKNAGEQVINLQDWAHRNPPIPQILPCPFCGGKAEIYNVGIGWYNVHCADYDCIGSNAAKIMSTREDAVKAWNRRKNNV